MKGPWNETSPWFTSLVPKPLSAGSVVLGMRLLAPYTCVWLFVYSIYSVQCSTVHISIVYACTYVHIDFIENLGLKRRWVEGTVITQEPGNELISVPSGDTV